MRTLVVYFSRTGHTRNVAHAIARELDADVEEIADATQRRGLLGYLRSAYEAERERSARIAPPVSSAGDYDLVVIGTPVWDANVSSPVRAYLRATRGTLPAKVAFFCTLGGRGSRRVLDKMTVAAGVRPVAELALTERDLAHPSWERAVRDFAERLAAGSTDRGAAASATAGAHGASFTAAHGRHGA
ncbi:MAG TPA: NAD(P)H-dependent oxidoreductase [Minicystis sp.]|nr:NAD(P)H-dependent oxidoreductase [Minicystis sp.]